MTVPEPMQTCATCGERFVDQPEALCEFFGIENTRLVHTGLVIFDPTAGCDVPDLDTCPRANCPNRKAAP